MNRSNQFRREAEDASMEGMMSNRSIAGRESVMASVVKAAAVFNNMLMENCNLCTVYCDKQVQYEDYVQQQYDVSTGAMGHLYAHLNPASATAATTSMPAGTAIQASNIERTTVNNTATTEANTPPNNTMKSPTMSSNDPRIQAQNYYREFLFDEESVVRSVGSRGARDDEE